MLCKIFDKIVYFFRIFLEDFSKESEKCQYTVDTESIRKLSKFIFKKPLLSK